MTALEKARFARHAVVDIRGSVVSFSMPIGMGSLLTAVEVLAEAVEELALGGAVAGIPETITEDDLSNLINEVRSEGS